MAASSCGATCCASSSSTTRNSPVCCQRPTIFSPAPPPQGTAQTRLRDSDYDAFGHIYEYFLGEFATSEGQGSGEPNGASSTTGTVARMVSASDSANQFYTPSSIVSEHKASPPSTRPAGHPSPTGRRAGDEGLAAKYSGDPSRELSIHGVEKNDETVRLSRQFVHSRLVPHEADCRGCRQKSQRRPMQNRPQISDPRPSMTAPRRRF